MLFFAGVGLLATQAAWGAEEAEELNAFGFPEHSLVAVIDNSTSQPQICKSAMLPDCTTHSLASQASQTLQPYADRDGDSIISKRRRDLILKNIKNFSPVDANNLDLEQDAVVADRLMELKINEHIPREDVKVCRSNNVFLQSNVYLLMYFVDDAVKVEVLNFPSDKRPQFVFQQN